ncbi:condensation domain-containing protein [Chroococcidiopsis sp. CCMEE 29]|uniref:condensation domain-containing protein n=1 Tax=Chroococcidiopsis sp. CCMEE 29 TaxID=155894 RepID=UPI002020A2DD|nr:condensation domain-containing protein [Chroococcidiopsis sp. CCMEE 29]
MNKKNIEAIYPLSSAQQGMLFETLYAPESGIHVEQLSCALQGNLDLTTFEQAWQRVIDRHPTLRTGFVWKEQNEPLQVVLQRVEVPLERYDWRRLSSPEQQEQLEAFLEADRHRGFQLSKAPLMRLSLIHLAEDDYQLIWSHHHILLDGWSLPLIFKEVFAFYQVFRKGQDLHLEQPRPYRDYIAWLKQQDLSKAETFWQKTLQGCTKPTPLGMKADPGSFSGQEQGYGKQRAYLPAPALHQLQSLARQYRLTLNTLVQGVWALLLSRYSGEEDVVFGTTVSGRPSDLAGSESMIGLFTNTLPVRVKVFSKASLCSWLKDIQTYNFGLRQYEYSPGGKVHQWSGLPGSLPLYESIVVFENYPSNVDLGQSSDLRVDILDYRFKGTQTKYALILQVKAGPELRLQLVYDGRRLDRTNVTQILEHFQVLLQDVIADPEQHLTTLLDKIPANQIPKIRPLQKSEQQGLETTFVAPRTPVEEVVAGIWANILGLEQVGINDNFFELGGHSLLATQVMSHVRNALQLELPLRCLFESPTVAGLAKSIETSNPESDLQAPPIQRVSRDGELPLSFAQQRLWFLEQLEPGTATYNIPAAVLLTGSLNGVALEQSLNQVIKHHEALRTNFATVEGRPIQIIKEALTLTLLVIDLQDLSDPEREFEVRRLATEEAQIPFDLEQGPLLRVTLLRLSQEEHIVLLTMHHIVSDGWSMGVLLRELAALYEAFSTGKSSSLPELPIQYADFAAWQQQWLQGEVLETKLAYWKQQLGGNLPVLQLPTDHPRAAVKTRRGAIQSFLLPSTLSQELHALSRKESVTLFMTLLAAFQALLHRYTNQDDIVVGTDVANRNRIETESLIGFFVNLLVLRTDLSGNPSFRELLGRVRKVALGAYAHQDLPFEKLVEALRPERNSSHTPLFQVLFVLQNAPMPPLELPGLTLRLLEVDNETSKFDLALFLTETERGLVATWQYNADLFEAATIARISAHFATLLDSIVAQPNARLNALEMLTETEREQGAVEKTEQKALKLKKFMNVKPKAVNLSQERLIKTDYLQPGETLPLVIQPDVDDIDLVEWVQSNREFIETNLLKHGAILFRGFKVNSVPEFENFAQAVCPELFGEYGDLPREGISSKVYGSTPYPSDQAILFHNESSHLHRWPMKIWFFCVQPAQQGGETPIVDSRKIFQLLDPKIRARFQQKQLMYVRNYTDNLDVSWQEFFHTTDKSVVEDYCRQACINFEWKDNGLRTRQIRPAVTKHPKTDELVFFNQIQLHHISCLDPAVRESLLSLFGEENLPRHVYYGDRTPIEDSVIDEIQAVYRQATISFPWRKGDVLMLDNMLTAHGRNPYVGSRKIVVAMGEMMTQKQMEQRVLEEAHAQ